MQEREKLNITYVKSTKAKLIKIKSKMVMTRGWWGKDIGEMLFKGTNLQLVDK